MINLIVTTKMLSLVVIDIHFFFFFLEEVMALDRPKIEHNSRAHVQPLEGPVVKLRYWRK